MPVLFNKKFWSTYGVLKKNFWVRTETNRNKICFDCVSVCFMKPKSKIFGLFRFVSVFRTYIDNGNKQNCFESNRNNPKFSEKYQNMLSIKLFQLVFCLFRFNWNIETRCFGIEFETTKKTVSKQTKTNRKKPKQRKILWKNTNICYLSNCFGWSSVCFNSIETSKLSVSV